MNNDNNIPAFDEQRINRLVERRLEQVRRSLSCALINIYYTENFSIGCNERSLPKFPASIPALIDTIAADSRLMNRTVLTAAEADSDPGRSWRITVETRHGRSATLVCNPPSLSNNPHRYSVTVLLKNKKNAACRDDITRIPLPVTRGSFILSEFALSDNELQLLLDDSEDDQPEKLLTVRFDRQPQDSPAYRQALRQTLAAGRLQPLLDAMRTWHDYPQLRAWMTAFFLAQSAPDLRERFYRSSKVRFRRKPQRRQPPAQSFEFISLSTISSGNEDDPEKELPPRLEQLIRELHSSGFSEQCGASRILNAADTLYTDPDHGRRELLRIAEENGDHKLQQLCRTPGISCDEIYHRAVESAFWDLSD